MKTEDYVKEVEKIEESTNTVELINGDTLYIKLYGNQDLNSIRDVDQRSIKLIKELDFKPNVLIDANYTGLPDAEARKEIISSFNRDDYNAQAIFGLNEALRVVANVMLGRVLARDRTKLFKTEKEAREWLANNPATNNKGNIHKANK